VGTENGTNDAPTVHRPRENSCVGWMLWCGVGVMFSTRWTRRLLLVGIMPRQRLSLYTQTENVKQLRATCSECTLTVYCGCCDDTLD
jgi:hypothetical protein